jgi:hypothetical protein
MNRRSRVRVVHNIEQTFWNVKCEGRLLTEPALVTVIERVRRAAGAYADGAQPLGVRLPAYPAH